MSANDEVEQPQPQPQQPQQQAPPAKKGVCYQFQRSGRCRFGEACVFTHRRSPRKTQSKAEAVTEAGTEAEAKPKAETDIQTSRQPPKPKANNDDDDEASSGVALPTPPASDDVLHDPMDDYFAQYPAFRYNRNAHFTQEFNRMCRHFRWPASSPERREAQASFRIALVEQFNTVYGTDEHELESWQRLCRILGMGAPDTLKKARRRVRNTHVNLVDLVECHRTGARIEKFPSLEALKKYTIEEGKFFPKEEAYAGGLLRMLLREIINQRGPRKQPQQQQQPPQQQQQQQADASVALPV